MKVSTLVAFMAAAAIVPVLAAPNTPSASPSSTRPSNESRPFTTNIDDDIVQSRVLGFNREELAVLFAPLIEVMVGYITYAAVLIRVAFTTRPEYLCLALRERFRTKEPELVLTITDLPQDSIVAYVRGISVVVRILPKSSPHPCSAVSNAPCETK
ncbi:hypothetical protein BGZ91_009705 [Linnemannia elongata]|nr:hypothetical protein BGZ91_009705 [Linnemannia elongata]